MQVLPPKALALVEASCHAAAAVTDACTVVVAAVAAAARTGNDGDHEIPVTAVAVVATLMMTTRVMPADKR